MKMFQFLNLSMPKVSFVSFKILMVLLVVTISFTSCNDDDDDDTEPAMTTKTIADIVVEGNDFSSLEAALIKADLVTVFQGSTEYTVFAPTNAAFEAFLTANNLTLETVPVPLLTSVLQQHVVAGEVKSSALSDGQIVPTLNADVFLNVGISAGSVMINNATVTQADVDASNGVIHVVNQVILP